MMERGLKSYVSSVTPLCASKHTRKSVCLSPTGSYLRPGGDTLRRCRCTYAFTFLHICLECVADALRWCWSRCLRSSCAIAKPHMRDGILSLPIWTHIAHSTYSLSLSATSLSPRLRFRTRISFSYERAVKVVFRDHYYRNSRVYSGLSLRLPLSRNRIALNRLMIAPQSLATHCRHYVIAVKPHWYDNKWTDKMIDHWIRQRKRRLAITRSENVYIKQFEILKRWGEIHVSRVAFLYQYFDAAAGLR